MNEKFNKNAKVEKLTKKLGRGVRLIVIGPFYYARTEFISKCKNILFSIEDIIKMYEFTGAI